MQVYIDSREKARAIKNIVAEFNKQGVSYVISKLYVGDYQSFDNPRVIIDRKQNLTEICSNVTNNHDRFRNELIRARDNGIKLIILIEHSNQIKSIDDVAKWHNPRDKEVKTWVDDRCVTNKNGEEYWIPAHYEISRTKAVTGETLANIMRTQERKYGCEFQFCDKLHTGKKIIELLGGDRIDK